MLTYPQLWSWRSLCEFLDSQWYKFAVPETIDQQAKIPLRKIYAQTGVEHRRLLKDLYWISLIRWGDHPVLDFSASRANRREFRGVQGWTLLGGWEHKIDFLEQVYLLGRDPKTLAMPWAEPARQRHLERQRRQRQWIQQQLRWRREHEQREQQQRTHLVSPHPCPGR